jgi:UDP-N-acetylmuramyl pentapeptide phosphotransferase/UDP-N-acetylglucosamine-1-phosphate transferase
MVFATTALLSFCLGSPAYLFLRQAGLLDEPKLRSSHIRPTVRGGGISILLSLALACSFLRQDLEWQLPTIIGLSTALIAILSFWDDWKGLSPFVRLCFHTSAALVLLLALFLPSAFHQFTGNTAGNWIPAWCWLAGLLWLVGYTNAFNFMDGINGLAAGQALVTSAGAGALIGLHKGVWSDSSVLCFFVMAGAAAGFLPYNFPRARMFMGDVGSASLGFLSAALILLVTVNTDLSLSIPLVLLHANFVLDTVITFSRRFLKGERWYEPHREHFYQRLVRAGKSHTYVTSCEMGLQLVVLFLMFLYLQAGLTLKILLVMATILLWLSFFAYCEWEFRRSQHSGATCASQLSC